jgi:uncharacterized protein (DUF2252 family)
MAAARTAVCKAGGIAMNIREATESYERWMRHATPVVESQLRAKHAEMRADCFAFFRGTYYRWAQVWTSLVEDCRRAPQVLAVGDLHIDSFGTWRDAEGRLAWGVDDFDEAYPLPYTNDLVRLAASLKINIDGGVIDLKLKEGCEAILDGYRSTLQNGSCPIVLAEEEEHLETLGIRVIKPPGDFWSNLNALPAARHGVPRAAIRALTATLPHPSPTGRKIVRRRAGLGSLGQPRYVLIGHWEGGCIAREAKALVPSSCVWAAGRRGRGQTYYERAMRGAARARDPFQRAIGGWLVRRLSPDSNPIEIAAQSGRRDDLVLLRSMGIEAGNVHIGSRTPSKAVIADLRRRKPYWLHSAAKTMARAMEREWKEYKNGRA